MENKTEQQDVKDADVSSVEASETESKSVLIWIIVAVLVCLQLGSFWLWNQQKQEAESLNQQVLAAMGASDDASTLSLSLQETDTNIKSQLTGLDDKQSALAERIKVLSDSQQITRGDVEQYWALAEVEYLLNVANQRVLLAKDVVGAHEALAMADERIEALSDYRLHPLRALLADETLALSSVVKVDVDGIALQLQSALDSIDNLQILMSSPLSEEEASDAIASDDWQGALDQAWQEVKSLVVIRHQQDGAAAVLVPEQRYFLYQNLRLKLETARFALLSGQPVVFEASLAAAKKWLKQYFVGEERDAMLASVSELQSTNTNVSLPDISASLEWLKGFER